jgi:hypothetical protein
MRGAVQCFTSASFSYLDRVRVLGETLRRHQPDWTFHLCLADEEPPGFTFDPAREPIDRVVRLGELGLPRPRQWIFGHALVELCTAVKGPMLWRLLERGADKVVYLDPDTALFADLGQIETLLEHHAAVLTPHLLAPEEALDAIRDNEIGCLKHGVYNLGFLAVTNTDEGRRFARWWRDRLLAFCFDDIPQGLFTDQRWCDLAPAFFPGVHILRDPGYNVASWNLSRRPITIGEDGVIRAGGRILRFFHFTKVNGPGGVMLERYGGAHLLAVLELLYWYRGRLEANAPAGLPPGWWAYGRYADGSAIPPAHRLAYRTRADLRERFPDPFDAGAEPLAAFLAGNPA